MKKKILVVSILICICIIGVGLVIYFVNKTDDDDSTIIGDSYEQDIAVVNISHPYNVLVYGEPIYFRETFKYTQIEEITADVLELDETQYEHVALIVSDMEGSVEIDDQTYELIRDYLDTGNLDFYYVGTDKREQIKKTFNC